MFSKVFMTAVLSVSAEDRFLDAIVATAPVASVVSTSEIPDGCGNCLSSDASGNWIKPCLLSTAADNDACSSLTGIQDNYQQVGTELMFNKFPGCMCPQVGYKRDAFSGMMKLAKMQVGTPAYETQLTQISPYVNQYFGCNPGNCNLNNMLGSYAAPTYGGSNFLSSFGSGWNNDFKYFNQNRMHFRHNIRDDTKYSHHYRENTNMNANSLTKMSANQRGHEFGNMFQNAYMGF